MRQAAAFLKDKTALFKEEPDTQANRLGAENNPRPPPSLSHHPHSHPIHTPLLPCTGTHTHTLLPSLQAASREGVKAECINKRKL